MKYCTYLQPFRRTLKANSNQTSEDCLEADIERAVDEKIDATVDHEKKVAKTAMKLELESRIG